MCIFIVTDSCNNNQLRNNSVDTSKVESEPSNTYSSNNDSTTQESSNLNAENTLKMIARFSESEFRDSRKELIEQGAEYNYKISEIKKLGDLLKYDVVIPGIEVKMEYSCDPKHGDYTIIMTGDKDVAQMQYNQNKVELKWDNCNTTENGEKCDTYQDMESYPLKTHFTISIVNYQTEAVFIFHRLIMPK